MRRHGNSWQKIYDFYHIQCIGDCPGLHFEHNPLIDENTRRLIYKHIFPDVVPREKRPFLSFPLDIRDILKMDRKQLKWELKIRNLNQSGNLKGMGRRLQLFQDSKEVRSVLSKALVMGYSRRMEEGDAKMNIPVYLKQIVDNYFGCRSAKYSVGCGGCGCCPRR